MQVKYELLQINFTAKSLNVLAYQLCSCVQLNILFYNTPVYSGIHVKYVFKPDALRKILCSNRLQCTQQSDTLVCPSLITYHGHSLLYLDQIFWRNRQLVPGSVSLQNPVAWLQTCLMSPWSRLMLPHSGRQVGFGWGTARLLATNVSTLCGFWKA